MNLKKILCPVDLSDGARAALDAATDLARQYGAELTILHAFPERDMPSGVFLTLGARSGSEEDRLPPEEKRMKQRLADLERLAREAGVANVTVETPHGDDPADEILRVATDGEYDLIVMGKNGTTGMLKALLGSVSYRLVRAATCSVLTVRAPQQAK